MRDAHFVLLTCLVLLQNFLVKFPRQQVSQMLGKHNLTLQDKIHVSIHLFSERKERGKKSLWRVWSKIFPRTSGRQMARACNFYILCRIAYKMEIQTNIRKSLFQEMREFSLILFSLGLSLGLHGILICWAGSKPGVRDERAGCVLMHLLLHQEPIHLLVKWKTCHYQMMNQIQMTPETYRNLPFPWVSQGW